MQVEATPVPRTILLHEWCIDNHIKIVLNYNNLLCEFQTTVMWYEENDMSTNEMFYGHNVVFLTANELNILKTILPSALDESLPSVYIHCLLSKDTDASMEVINSLYKLSITCYEAVECMQELIILQPIESFFWLQAVIGYVLNSIEDAERQTEEYLQLATAALVISELRYDNSRELDDIFDVISLVEVVNIARTSCIEFTKLKEFPQTVFNQQLYNVKKFKIKEHRVKVEELISLYINRPLFTGDCTRDMKYLICETLF